jgi:hypothetical protein
VLFRASKNFRFGAHHAERPDFDTYRIFALINNDRQRRDIRWWKIALARFDASIKRNGIHQSKISCRLAIGMGNNDLLHQRENHF